MVNTRDDEYILRIATELSRTNHCIPYDVFDLKFSEWIRPRGGVLTRKTCIDRRRRTSPIRYTRYRDNVHYAFRRQNVIAMMIGAAKGTADDDGFVRWLLKTQERVLNTLLATFVLPIFAVNYTFVHTDCRTRILLVGKQSVRADLLPVFAAADAATVLKKYGCLAKRFGVVRRTGIDRAQTSAVATTTTPPPPPSENRIILSQTIYAVRLKIN